MDENLALQENADRGDPVSIEVLGTIRSETEREREAEAIAQSELPMNCNVILFEMQEDVQEHTDDPPVDDSPLL
jgi:hypothetical protein